MRPREPIAVPRGPRPAIAVSDVGVSERPAVAVQIGGAEDPRVRDAVDRLAALDETGEAQGQLPPRIRVGDGAHDVAPVVDRRPVLRSEVVGVLGPEVDVVGVVLEPRERVGQAEGVADRRAGPSRATRWPRSTAPLPAFSVTMTLRAPPGRMGTGRVALASASVRTTTFERVDRVGRRRVQVAEARQAVGPGVDEVDVEQVGPPQLPLEAEGELLGLRVRVPVRVEDAPLAGRRCWPRCAWASADVGPSEVRNPGVVGASGSRRR